MLEIAKELLKLLGPMGAVVLGLAVIYFNPSDAAEFQRNTMDQLAKVQAQYDQSQRSLDILKEQNLKQVAQINQLKQQLLTLQSTEDSWPYPAWLKDSSGQLLFANKAYVDKYLTPRGYSLQDYLGGTDGDVWPKYIADQFRHNDEQVMRSGHHVIVLETVEMPTGIEKHLFIKYPRRLGGVVVGVAGRYLPRIEDE